MAATSRLLVSVAAVLQSRRSASPVPLLASFVIDLPELGGAARLAAKAVDVHTLVSFEGH